MKKVYECEHCGVITEIPEQLCEPYKIYEKGADCSMTQAVGDMCKKIKKRHTHVCGTCGRVAEQVELLCNPDVPW